MKQVTGGWSKYGGGKYQAAREELSEIWCCQSCGKQQPSDMPPYLWELSPDEYVRVCATCLSNDCAMLKKRRAS